MTREEIERHIRTKFFGREIHAFDTLDSTNSFAKTIAADGAPEGTLVIAEEQLTGRGRHGRRWHSAPGSNLTFSIVIRPAISPKFIGLLSLYAGLAVAEALDKFAPVKPTCKWPNDVLVDGKKICGILSEVTFTRGILDAAVVGIGLNVNQTEFLPAIGKPPTSLACCAGRTFDRYIVLAEILLRLEMRYDLIRQMKYQQLIDTWLDWTTMIGKEVIVDQQGELITGIPKALADDGGLILETTHGERKVVAGDVTIVP